MKYYVSTFGAAYGACAYGQNSYQNNDANCSTTTTTSGGGATSTSSPLTNTGFDVLLAATIACVLIFGALVVRFIRKPKKTAN